MSGRDSGSSSDSSEDESLDLDLEYSSEIEGEDENRGAEFGLFEPIISDDELALREQQVARVEIDEGRLLNTNWCKCGGFCQVPESFNLGDCICCREIIQVSEEADRHEVSCITIAPAFEPAILHPVSLYIGWMEYTDRWRRQARKYRYVAYRKLVRWCWGWLGKDIRVQLPACAHARIMNDYPSNGEYKGTILRPLVIN